MNKKIKIAILEKVTDILDNTKCVGDADISIRYREDEVPTILYSIREKIVPEVENERL